MTRGWWHAGDQGANPAPKKRAAHSAPTTPQKGKKGKAPEDTPPRALAAKAQTPGSSRCGMLAQ
jgi:hypothetical protein